MLNFNSKLGQIYVLLAAAFAQRVCLQPYSRLWNCTDDERETLLCRVSRNSVKWRMLSSIQVWTSKQMPWLPKIHQQYYLDMSWNSKTWHFPEQSLVSLDTYFSIYIHHFYIVVYCGSSFTACLRIPCKQILLRSSQRNREEEGDRETALRFPIEHAPTKR